MASQKLLNMRKTTRQRLAMKTQKKDWDGFQVKPPPLRRKAGSVTGTRLAEPAAPGTSKGELTK